MFLGVVALAVVVHPTPKPSPAPFKTITTIVSRPVRRVVYSVDVSSRVSGSVHTTMREIDVDALNKPPSEGMPVASQESGSGTVTLEITRALPDGSFVLVASEDAGQRTTQPLLLGVTGAGSLVLSREAYNDLLPEEAQLASLLARNTIIGHDITPGAAWEIQDHGTADSKINFTVKAADGATATLAVKCEQVGKDTSATTYGFTGTMTYDLLHSTLLSGEFDTYQTTMQFGSQLRMEMHAKYRLVADSLGAAPPH